MDLAFSGCKKMSSVTWYIGARAAPAFLKVARQRDIGLIGSVGNCNSHSHDDGRQRLETERPKHSTRCANVGPAGPLNRALRPRGLNSQQWSQSTSRIDFLVKRSASRAAARMSGFAIGGWQDKEVSFTFKVSNIA
jgi:hypothetical protein